LITITSFLADGVGIAKDSIARTIRRAIHSISKVTKLATALKRTHSIYALCLPMTVVLQWLTFVDIGACSTVSLPTIFTLALSAFFGKRSETFGIRVANYSFTGAIRDASKTVSLVTRSTSTLI